MAGFPNLARSKQKLEQIPGRLPSGIVHLVVDGMSSGTFACGDYLSHEVRKRGLTWTRLLHSEGTHSCVMNMRSIDSMVTDSAAASSSWGSGSRVPNGALNILPSGKSLVPLFSLMAEQGWKRGLVTTTELTHATPAGFAARTFSRENASEIAEQYLKSGIDLLLGGGAKHFSRGSRTDQRDLFGDFIANGYCALRSADDLSCAPLERRWLGTFDSGHLPFAVDRESNPQVKARVPSLATMAERALQWMGRHENFLLQIEGGRVDHAAHNCDAPSALRDLIAFDEALDVVLQFQSSRPDILVVVTTDHGNGNMGLNGTGDRYSQSTSVFQRVTRAKASFPEILRQMRDGLDRGGVPDVRTIREVLDANTGYLPPESKAAMFHTFLAQQGSCLYEEMNSETAQLGQLMANHTGIGWTSGAHTADFVPLTAVGPGANHFSGFIQNTELFKIYMKFAKIDFKNPEEPLISSSRNPGCVEDVRAYASTVA